MEKTGLFQSIITGVFALISILLFSGASIWEGAAAVAVGGDLPEAGFYVATNSFPRNTVVDVTNLETGKTVRGIVSAGLDAPGLLAILSRESALAVGLQSRSIGRIRMTAPQDPVANSRFGGENLRSGDPDHDPEAALRAYNDKKEETDEAAQVSPSGAASTVETPPPGKKAGETFAREEEDFFDTWKDTESLAFEEDTEDTAAGMIVEEEAAAGNFEEEFTGETAITENEEIPSERAWFIPENEEDAEIAAGETGGKWSLVPSEERPPEYDYSQYPDERYFIDPVSDRAGGSPDPDGKSSGSSYPPALFSIPSVVELEAGKYYLQLGAFAKAETVESEVKKIGKSYPLAVQRAGSADKPVYRVLIGPVNHGESGALLQRFRGRGYKDAFIRKGK